METSKIIAFRALKTLIHKLKSRRTQNQSLFENEQGVVVTVNVDRYRAMLDEFLFTKIEEENIGNIWVQQDDATCHTAETALDV